MASSNSKVPGSKLLRLLVPVINQGGGAEEQRLTSLKSYNLFEKSCGDWLRPIVVTASGFVSNGKLCRQACDVTLEGLEPARTLEVMDNGRGTQLEKLRGKCRLLRRDDDARSKMALLANDLK